MELLKWELRKIWRPSVLAALGVLGALYFFLFPSFYIEYFSNGSEAQAQFDLSAGWAERYGPAMEPEERAELDGQLRREMEAFEKRIAGIPAAAEAGLTDYAAFLALRDAYYGDTLAAGGLADPDVERLLHLVADNTNYEAITALEGFLERYDALESGFYSPSDLRDGGYTEAMLQRTGAIEKSSLRHGFLPTGVRDSTAAYGKDLAVWAVLSVVLLLSPTLVRDRLRQTRALQWSSRRGRSVLRVQLAAAGLSALGLTALNLAAYAAPFLAQGPLIFRACGLYSLWDGGAPWFDWTYGTYLAALCGLITALSLAAAGLTVFLSQFSGDYVSMLLKALPLFALLGPLLGAWMLDGPFYFRVLREGSGLWVPRGGEAALAAGLLLLALGLCALALRRQRRREL